MSFWRALLDHRLCPRRHSRYCQPPPAACTRAEPPTSAPGTPFSSLPTQVEKGCITVFFGVMVHGSPSGSQVKQLKPLPLNRGCMKPSLLQLPHPAVCTNMSPGLLSLILKSSLLIKSPVQYSKDIFPKCLFFSVKLEQHALNSREL